MQIHRTNRTIKEPVGSAVIDPRSPVGPRDRDHPRLMEIRHLRYLVAVAEELHFGRAATRLNIAKPPLSRAIRQLEDNVGAKLFNRTTRTIALTPAGESLLEDAYLILDMVGNAARSARNTASDRKRKLRIGIAETTTTGPLPRILSIFHDRFPDIELTLYELPTSQQPRALFSRSIDVGLLIPPADIAEFLTEPLWEERYRLAVPESHPFAKRTRIAVADLADQPLILCHPTFGSGAHRQILDIFHRAGFEPKIVQYALRRQTMMTLVSAGYGLALVPESFDPGGIPGVVVRSFEPPEPRIQVTLARRRDDKEPAIAEFVSIVRAVCDDNAVAC